MFPTGAEEVRVKGQKLIFFKKNHLCIPVVEFLLYCGGQSDHRVKMYNML